MKKLLTTRNTAREVAETTPRPSGGFISTHAPLLSDAAYVARFATADELAGLRLLVEERLAARPRQTYWSCKKCGQTVVLGPDAVEPVNCFFCNRPRYQDGGWCRQLKGKEIEEFKTTQAERTAKANARAQTAAFNARNQARLKEGQEPITREQFDAQAREDYRAMVARIQRPRAGA